jgi:hypothetical protein
MTSLLGFRGTASITLKYSLLSPLNSALKYLKIYSIISPKYFFPLPCDFMFRVLCHGIYPPWNMPSYHLESIPKISLNLFYFPKNTTLNAPHIYFTQPLNSTLFQTPKKLPNPPNSSPNFAILVPSNAPPKNFPIRQTPHPKA